MGEWVVRVVVGLIALAGLSSSVSWRWQRPLDGKSSLQFCDANYLDISK